MEKKFISDLKVNERVNSYFILRKKDLKLTKHDKPYLEIGLADKTGKIEGRLWDNADKFNEAAETGDVIHVVGTVDKYREEKQLKIDSIEKADDRAFTFEDMVRIAEGRDRIYSDILTQLEDIKNPWILSLAREFTGDEDLINKFKEGLGGKSWHGAYIGGLMEHTYDVMYIAVKVCDLYPEADRDIISLGSFIHDIGKIFELDIKKQEYTIEGGLLGHITIGYRILNEKISKIDGFPDDLRLRLEHIILSHHGEYEQQSPVLPKTLEATIVYQTDELVSQANAIKEIQVSQQEEGKVWSNFVFIKGRKYYIKPAADELWKGEASSEKDSPEDLFGK
ncbi:MAG: HD domain-containing protein [Candidatus Aadella gelida]|nr:HD domain-containing protein [Candidatus Aadella gelida]